MFLLLIAVTGIAWTLNWGKDDFNPPWSLIFYLLYNLPP
jgi:uncharacterized iron-regulated membrane protein